MSDTLGNRRADPVADHREPDTQSQQAGYGQLAPHRVDGTDHATLLAKLHRASRAIAAASDTAAVGQALMTFAASGTVDVARLLLFTDDENGRPTSIEMHEGWTRDNRSAQPYGTRLSLADYPLLEFMHADAVVTCENATTDERLNKPTRDLMAISGVGSFAIIPLSAGQHWLGALIIGRDTPSHFDEELIHAWWMLAGQAAAIIHNVRLHQETQQRLKEFSLLLDTSTAASASLDVDTVLQLTTEQIATTLRVDGCAISLWDRDQDALVTRMDYSVQPDRWTPDEPGTVYPLADLPASRQVLNSREPLTVQANDPDAEPTELAWMTEQGVGSVVIAPMVVRDEAIGVLEIMQNIESGERHFTSTEIALCQTLANQAAVALENARLFEQTQRSSVQLRTAAEVSRAASGILDPYRLIREAVDLVRERFDLYYVGLFLVDESGEWAVLRAGTGEAGRVQLEQGHKLQVGGDSMIGWCVANAQARIALDVAEETSRFINPLLPQTRSEMALPLISRGEVIGAVTIQSIKSAAFSQEDISVLQTMADQLANAIHNAQLFEQRSQRTDELHTLHIMAATVSRSLEMQELLERSLEIVVTALNFDAGLISLYNEGTRELVLASHRGLPEPMVMLLERHGLKGTLCEAVFQTGDTLSIGDVRQEAPTDTSGLIKHGIHAYAGTPLIYQTNTMGTLCLFNRAVRELNAAQFSLLKTLGHQIGVGVQNARLFEQTQARADELAMLFELGQKLNSTLLRPQEITEIVARQLLEMGDLECSFSLLAEDRDTLVVLTDLFVENGGISRWEEPGEIFHLSDYPATAHVMKTLQPIVVQIDDPHSDPAELAYMREHEMATLVIMPLAVKGKAIGVMEVESSQKHHFTSSQIDLMVALANQAAAALENTRLFEQTQAALAETEVRARELAVLNELGQALTARLSVEQVLEEAYRQASRLVDTTNFYIGLYDAEKDNIEFVLDVTESEIDQQITSIPASKGISGYVLRNRKGMLIRENLLQRLEDLGVEIIGEIPLSWIGVPMILGDQALGVMGVQNFHTPRAYDEHDRDLMSAIANQTAIAIQNARLFEEMQIRAEREKQLSQIMALINASEDLARHIPTITEHIRRLVPVDVLTLTSFDDGDDEFTILAIGAEPESGHFAEPGSRSPLEGTAPGWVITHREPWLDTDFRHYQPFASDEILVKEGLVSRLLLPLKVGEQVIGTLNMASRQPAAFSEVNSPLLSQIADQMALALQRARLLENTQKALDEVRATHQRYLREQWEDTLAASIEPTHGYLAGPQGVTAAGEVWTPEMEQAIATGQLVAISSDKDNQSSDRSAMAIPIQLRGQMIGVLDFYDEDHVWTEDDKALVQALADQLSLALENARLFQQTQASLAETQTLFETSRNLTAAQEPDEIWPVVIEAVSKQGGDACGIFLFDTREQVTTLHLRSGHHTASELVLINAWDKRHDPPRLFNIARPPLLDLDLFNTLSPDQPFYVTDLAQANDIDEHTRNLLSELGFSALLHQPIAVRGQWFGLLTILYESPHAFSGTETDFYRALADQTALAFEGQRLFTETQRRAEREELIRHITDKVRATSSLETILQTTVEEMSKAMRLPRAFIQLSVEPGLSTPPRTQSATANEKGQTTRPRSTESVERRHSRLSTVEEERDD
jgi:GAF domain-containing protein